MPLSEVIVMACAKSGSGPGPKSKWWSRRLLQSDERVSKEKKRGKIGMTYRNTWLSRMAKYLPRQALWPVAKGIHASEFPL